MPQQVVSTTKSDRRRLKYPSLRAVVRATTQQEVPRRKQPEIIRMGTTWKGDYPPLAPRWRELPAML